MRRSLLLLAILALVCAGRSGYAVELATVIARARASVSSEQLREHVETLASDSLEGREAGQQGGRSASTYVMQELKQAEVAPAGADGTYFQEFGAGYRNVLGVVPGSDAELRDEYILLTAHFDHVGFGSKSSSNGPVGFIHNGADDNASGVACVLELARSLQSNQAGLRRSVLVIFWDAEEKGLWGSKYWLDHPTIPVESIRLLVNLDMVGRLRERQLTLAGTRSMPRLRAAWSRANVTGDLTLAFPWRVLNNSDHFPFFQRDVPITMVHTGLHDDYHRPTDDVERLNFAGIEQTTQLLVNLIFDVSSRQDLGVFRPESKQESSDEMQRYFERRSPIRRARLGISWQPDPDGGVRVQSVRQGSPADRHGLRAGDHITMINDRLLQGTEMLHQQLAVARHDIVFQVERGDGHLQKVTVVLDGEPMRIGIAWRENSAEPGSVMVSEVMPGTPAERAGLLRLDRVHSVGGVQVSSGAFRDLMAEAQGKVELMVERDGRLQMLQLELPDGDTPN